MFKAFISFARGQHRSEEESLTLPSADDVLLTMRSKMEHEQ